MQKSINLHLLLVTLAFVLCAPSSHGYNLSCQDVYQRYSDERHENYLEEIAFLTALESSDPPYHKKIIKKFINDLLAVPLDPHDTLALLRIGFHEQIFCEPWPLTIPILLKKLANGEFTNSLSREIARYRNSTDVLLPPHLESSHEQLNRLQMALTTIPSPFPQEVLLRDTNSQDFTSNFYYFLRKKDGKIFVKPNPTKGNKANVLKHGVMDFYQEGNKLGNRSEWNLVNGNGGPSLPPGRKIVSFSVAAEIIFAHDDQGKIYIYKPTEYKTPTKWNTHVGCPIPEELYLPRNMSAWSLSCALKIKPECRRSIEFMHPDDIVYYYEDADHKKIEFGFTTTAYVLSADRRKIYYWDTGLPANFSRAFTTPNRGNFVADALSAAGSTIMILGRSRDNTVEIYTRMFDYEINGACPGEQHTYIDTQDQKSTAVLDLYSARRKLPLPGWTKMAGIELDTNDSLSNRISIEVTGQGNSARSLKVAGTKNGKPGYYHKLIDDNYWDFTRTHEIENGPLPADNSNNKTNSQYHDTAQNQMDYSGSIVQMPEDISALIKEIKLKDFHYYLGADEAAHIEIIDHHGASLVLDFHSNDAYSITGQKKRREELIGRAEGEAKPLLGTIRVPEKTPHDDSTDIRTIKNFFQQFHLKMNAFNILADNTHVEIKSVRPFIDMDNNHKMILFPKIKINFFRTDNSINYFLKLISEEEFFVRDTENNFHIKKIISKNKMLLHILSQEKNNIGTENFKNLCINTGTYLIFSCAQLFLFFTDYSVLNSLRKFIPQTAQMHQQINVRALLQRDKMTAAIDHAIGKVKNRIAAYKSLIEDNNYKSN